MSHQIKVVRRLGFDTAGWAQPGDGRGHQNSHAAVPYYGQGTGDGEHYTGHNGGHFGGFNQHNSGGYGHSH